MGTYRLLSELNEEWRRLDHEHSVGESGVGESGSLLSEWQRQQPALRGIDRWDDLLGQIRRFPDPTLRALLSLGCCNEDALAYRVILQALLGKVVLLSRGSEEWFDEAVSTLWVAIADYPLTRRPQAIISNLLWTLRRELAAPAEVMMPQRAPEPSPEATLRTALELGLIDEQALRTLWLVYILGLSGDRAGGVLGVSAENVRYRCSRTLRKLARQAPLLAA